MNECSDPFLLVTVMGPLHAETDAIQLTQKRNFKILLKTIIILEVYHNSLNSLCIVT